MKTVKIVPARLGLSGKLSFPGDKSLSHRAVIFGSLAEGRSHFTNVLPGEDCVCTRKAFEAMGVRISSSKDQTELTIDGVGLKGLKAPKSALYLGNSGTSMRLLMGVLAGQDFSATLTGDSSLSGRPMRRVAEPLGRMGAKITGKDNGNFAPITVTGASLQGISYHLPVASAQVKSALLLAGLYAKGTTRVTEPEKSRNHTEKFLKFFGASVNEDGLSVSVQAGKELKAKSFAIAGDISSAAFFMAAALLMPGSAVEFRSILNNPTRTGIVEILKRMGVKFVFDLDTKGEEGPEPTINFMLTSQALKLQAFEIKKSELPSLIDEIPILCVLATQAKGTSIIHDAGELRVKETDRINSMVSQLTRMGADIKSEGNSIIIQGPTPLKGAVVSSFKDHRTAMSLIVAGLIADGETTLEDIECISTSFPNFFDLLTTLKVSFEILNK